MNTSKSTKIAIIRCRGRSFDTRTSAFDKIFCIKSLLFNKAYYIQKGYNCQISPHFVAFSRALAAVFKGIVLNLKEAFFGRTHWFATTEPELISVCYGRGGYYPPVIRGTGLTIPQSASLPASFTQGSLTPFTSGASPRPTLNYGGCGYYPTLNFALCILNYEFVFRFWRNPFSLIGKGFSGKFRFGILSVLR